jgi:ABC-type transport system involved in multi-copper enzyme maturation permease subunit
MLGPILAREITIAPRRPKHYVQRAMYATGVFLLMCTAWLVLAGTQHIATIGDMARFGSTLFQILAPLQLALVAFLAALKAASSVAQEKDRGTLILLLMTRITNPELVVGKLLASLLDIAIMLWVAFPVFALLVLLGGVSLEQVLRVFAVTVATMLIAGSFGSIIALRNEKTFQTLAWTALGIVLWAVVSEAVVVGLQLGGIAEAPAIGVAISPARAILAAARPALVEPSSYDFAGNGVTWYLATMLAATLVLNVVSILRVRVWNPSREVHGGATKAEDVSVGVPASAGPEERPAKAGTPTRTVWHNPILWREMMTAAYGRKMILIRLAYLAIFALTLAGLYTTISSGSAFAHHATGQASLPPAARPLAPFFLVSLVMINALAVTCITTERDAKAIDLLLVTDLKPSEFLFGKLLGVCWVTKEMIALPMILGLILCLYGGLTVENFLYLVGSLAVMDVFAVMLGIHCGMHYANSRTAIGVSLGTIFFLFLGVATCIVMMISFAGSFESQLAPFLAFILGGSVGLYVALGIRNQSAAIAATALLLPFATFYAITSYFLGYPLTVFLVSAGMYGFATAAMLVPALSAFDFAMGRSRAAEED